jgi:hypothetical protein
VIFTTLLICLSSTECDKEEGEDLPERLFPAWFLPWSTSWGRGSRAWHDSNLCVSLPGPRH